MAAIVDYSTIKANLVAWVQDVAGEFLYTGVDGLGAVWWVEDAHDYQLAPYCELTWQDGGSVGMDELSWQSVDGDDDTLYPRMIGHRQVVVMFDFRSRNGADPARAGAEALRERFNNELGALALRRDYGLAPIEVVSFNQAGVVWEGRLETVVSVEMRFGYQTVVESVDLTVERVRNVGLRNQIVDSAGNLVGDNVQFLVGLDFPPSDPEPAQGSAFNNGFDALGFGSGTVAGGGGPFDSGFDLGFDI